MTDVEVEDKKRSLDDVDKDEERKPKKPKMFSIKEFRQHLYKDDKVQYLQQFLLSCLKKEDDYILLYLQHGGSCLELLQLLEYDSNIPQTLILEIVYYLLLEIIAKYPQLHAAGHEACRYLLNTYMTMLNKMLSSNSSVIEQELALKILTSVVTFSSNCAKDVLIHTNFNPTNLEILTKHTGEKESVRNAFINFISAFLVEGYYPTILALLEKKGLLTSVIKGLIYDVANSVCVLLTSLLNHVIENPFVSKTLKMKTFNTPVVKDIINLYNWKGPDGYGPKKKKTNVGQVDELAKSRVNQCVHNFLLVLCGSRKFGIIFRDPQVGLGRKYPNKLVYTVIDSLNNPWEHSYAGELVIKICGACPELTKFVWNNLKESIEPRSSKQWFKAMEFSKKLLLELNPEKIEYCVREINVSQLALITQSLIIPANIMRTLLAAADLKDVDVKYNVLNFILNDLGSVRDYLKFMEKALDELDFLEYKKLMVQYMGENLPQVENKLLNYRILDEDGINVSYLNAVIDLLDLYSELCPKLLNNLSSVDLKNLLTFLKNRSNQDTNSDLQIKVIKLFLTFDHAQFLPASAVFSEMVIFLLKAYHNAKHQDTYEILYRLFDSTSIFDGSEYEISIWINGVINSRNCSFDLRSFILETLVLGSSKLTDYLSKMEEIKDSVVENEIEPFKQVNLSPFIFALIENLNNRKSYKNIRNYVNYVVVNLLHNQTKPIILVKIVNNCSSISEDLYNYVNNFQNIVLDINENKLEILSKFSNAFANDSLKNILKEFDFGSDSHLKLDIFQMLIFNLQNFATNSNLKRSHIKNFLEYFDLVSSEKSCREKFLSNPVFLNYFSPLKTGENKYSLLTFLITELVKANSFEEALLTPFRSKLFGALLKILQKNKYKNLESEQILNIVKIFELNGELCHKFLNQVITIDLNNFINDHNNLSVIYHLSFYALNELHLTSKKYENFVILTESEKKVLLHEANIKYFVQLLIFLNSKTCNFETSSFVQAFVNYLKSYPHLVQFIDDNLFLTLLLKQEFVKENSALSSLLLENKPELIEILIENIDKMTITKGNILTLLDIIVKNNSKHEHLAIIYKKFEPILLKTLEKPQKAGQFFEKYYVTIGEIMKTFFPEKKCKSFVEKIQKFDVAEPFLAYILKVIFEKVFQTEVSEKHANNSILTYIHIFINLFKKNSHDKFEEIAKIVCEFLTYLFEKRIDIDFTQTVTNESFQTFTKFCLKFGISGQHKLLDLLALILRNMNVSPDSLNELMEMILSHSGFLDLVLNDDCDTKTEVLKLMHVIFKNCKDVMQRSQVPVLLAAYRATLSKSDRTILAMLRMFESDSSRTNFYDFQPFLWGHSAANHYSVRSNSKQAWRRPKMSMILDILEDEKVLNTIKYLDLDLELNSDLITIEVCGTSKAVYDLSFLLPLFALLLAPEDGVQTYRFTRSGALSLTILGLSSNDKSIRDASCYIISKFYSRVEMRTSGKDNTVWLRFVEAVCKGTAVQDDCKLNTFASIYLAKMALILSNPTHRLYLLFLQFLGAKSSPNFSGIPELYTLLHSADVHALDHKVFILELVRDGMRSKNDFMIALHSVCFKLILESYSSCLSDSATKLLILEILKRTTNIKTGVKLLCSNYGLLSWLYHVVLFLGNCKSEVHLILDVLSNIVKCNENYSQCLQILLHIFDNVSLDEERMLQLLKCVSSICGENNFLTEKRLRCINDVVRNKESLYFLKYSKDF